MRSDVKSNYNLIESHPAASQAIGAINGVTIDHADASSVSFLLSVGLVGASSTIDMKTQYSSDGVAWTDYPVLDEAGNDDAIAQIVAVGSAELHIPNPRERYSRVVTTVGAAASTLCVTAVLGPLRHVAV